MRRSNSLRVKLWLPPLLLITAFLGGCFLTEEPWLDLQNATTPLAPGHYVSNADTNKAIAIEKVADHYAVAVTVPGPPERPKLSPMYFDPVYLVAVPKTNNLFAFFFKEPVPTAGRPYMFNGKWVSIVTWLSPEGLFCLDDYYVGAHAPSGTLTGDPRGRLLGGNNVSVLGFSSSAAPEQLVEWIAQDQEEIATYLKTNAKMCYHPI
jgi:hypothetical protein